MVFVGVPLQLSRSRIRHHHCSNCSEWRGFNPWPKNCCRSRACPPPQKKAVFLNSRCGEFTGRRESVAETLPLRGYDLNHHHHKHAAGAPESGADTRPVHPLHRPATLPRLSEASQRGWGEEILCPQRQKDRGVKPQVFLPPLLREWPEANLLPC